MPQGRAVSPEIVAEARRLYESTTLSELKVAATCGFGQSTLRRYAQLGGWRRPGEGRGREQLVASLRARIDGEIAAAEAVMGVGAENRFRTDAEKTSRTLSNLVRTLRELAKLDDEQAARSGPANAHAGGDGDGSADGAIADLDELRASLARRLESLREQHET